MTTHDPIALYRLQLRAASERQLVSVRHRRRFLFPAGLAFAAIVLAGAALAASSWLSGQPAPPSVVSDFAGYTPQLGFDPDPGSAVLVAQDGDSSLYATTDSQGTYCIVASAPWKRPDNLPDGGDCIPQATAAQTIVAGIVGTSPTSTNTLEGTTTMLVAGRINEPGTIEVTFASPTGETISRPVGPSGFFLAIVSIQLCGNGDWTPTFTAFDDEGRQLAQSTFTIERQITLHDNTDKIGPYVCRFPIMTSAAAPSSNLRP